MIPWRSRVRGDTVVQCLSKLKNGLAFFFSGGITWWKTGRLLRRLYRAADQLYFVKAPVQRIQPVAPPLPPSLPVSFLPPLDYGSMTRDVSRICETKGGRGTQVLNYRQRAATLYISCVVWQADPLSENERLDSCLNYLQPNVFLTSSAWALGPFGKMPCCMTLFLLGQWWGGHPHLGFPPQTTEREWCTFTIY